MKNVCYLLLLVFFEVLGQATPLQAQDCPPPQDLQITIVEGNPSTALVSWTAPPGASIEGYLFTYAINGSNPVSIMLPPNPTSYIIDLPENWEEIEATLSTVCSDGKISSEETIKKTSLILVDLIMIRSEGVPEQRVCTGDCPTATHFGYGLTGNTLPSLQIYRNTSFCKCMSDNGNAYQDPQLVAACKLFALQIIDPNLFYLNICAISQREDAEYSNNAPQVRLSPNPATGHAVYVSGVNSGTFDCWDVSGRQVLSQPLTEEGQAVSIESLVRGIYLYKISQAGGPVAYGKLIRE